MGLWLKDGLPLALTAVVAGLVVFVPAKLAIYDTQPFFSWPALLALAVTGLVATTVIDALLKAIGWMRGGLTSLTPKK